MPPTATLKSAPLTGSRTAETGSLWDAVLRVLRERLRPTEFRKWFAPTRLLNEDQHSLVVGVPRRTFAERLDTHYRNHIGEALEAIGAGEVKIRFTAGEASPDPSQRPAVGTAVECFAESEPVAEHSRFANFVVGDSNRTAWAAARAVSEPSSRHTPYNPLVIHGDVGVGKTHLLQSIAERVRRKSPTSRVLLTKGESFTRHVVRAVRAQQLFAFREQLRQTDVLLVDDLPFLAGLDRFGRTTEEFFHALNALTESGRQIVLTANAHPQELTGVDKRIRTRLAAGLAAELGTPDQPTRVEIVLRRAMQAGVDLSQPVAELIASRFPHNVRELLGGLNRVLNTAQVNQLEITTTLASELLVRGRSPVTMEQVIVLTASEFGVPAARLPGTQRHRTVVLARHVAMFLCREAAGRTLAEIGRAFRRDHTTVAYGVKRIEARRRVDAGLDRVLEQLSHKLR